MTTTTKSKPIACDTDACCAGPTPPSVATKGGGTTFRIDAMDCAVEQAAIAHALDRVPGIGVVRFDLRARTLAIDAPPDTLQNAVAAIRAAGFDPRAQTASDHDADEVHNHTESASPRRLGLALGLAIAAEILELIAPGTTATLVLTLGMAAIAIWLAGTDTYRKGITAVRHGQLNINALMSVAVTGAFLIGQWPEAAMVMALYAIAEFIESKAADRARRAIEGLLELAPENAEVLQPDSSWRTVTTAEVAVGAVIRIGPGDRVPLDGTVTDGNSAVDQAPVTGESIPVEKAPGDILFAGAINQTAELKFRVTAPATDSTLARIIHAVEEAQQTRAPTQRLVDRFARFYTPAVFGIAVAFALGAPLIAGLTWLDAIYKALVLLVVACPCALVIATPITVVSALASAAKRGILIKGGAHLEAARHLRVIALDKTGTITTGKPKLVEWQSLRPDIERTHAARLAASLASRSDHPVSHAIAVGLPSAVGEVEGFQALPGRGVQGSIEGYLYTLANHRAIEERGQCSPDLERVLAEHENQGRTVTLLADEQGVVALFAVADTIKESSRTAVRELKALGVVPVMLTGDNAMTARSIATAAEIDQADGNLLPEDKLEAVRSLQKRYGFAGMVGDGINDAPALAQADIGVAMGVAGTDIAMEAADVAIMNDDLRQIPATIRLSRRTHRVLWQNIVLAVGIKAVFIVLALFGAATMWMAVFADMGATLLVVANGLRLLKAPSKGA